MTTFHSTRSTTDSLTSKQAIRKGIADDGGLFVTDSLGETHVDIASLAGKSYQQIAFDVLSVLLPDYTEAELKEKKSRIEDALQATRAAVEEGIVAGGGVAFMDAAPALDAVEIDDPEEKIGVDIVKKALTAPVATIAKNAGFEGAVVVDKVAELPAGQGLNSANGEWGDMIEMGVLDPVKVSRVTLQNAASVASLILITEATVSDVPKNTQLEDAIAAATAGQQGGGMY